jgi:hypothetical protein
MPRGYLNKDPLAWRVLIGGHSPRRQRAMRPGTVLIGGVWGSRLLKAVKQFAAAISAIRASEHEFP